MSELKNVKIFPVAHKVLCRVKKTRGISKTQFATDAIVAHETRSFVDASASRQSTAEKQFNR